MYNKQFKRMTKIQALELLNLDKPTAPERVTTREFEYIRHGVTMLIGYFSLSTGNVLSFLIKPIQNMALLQR